MSVITISRGSYSRGKDVAEILAKKLDYQCISREILLDASEQFNISELELLQGVHDAPSVLDILNSSPAKYAMFIQQALLKHAVGDNLVYHGLAGHFLLQGIPNVLKVRIVADLEYRQNIVMQRNGVGVEKALKILAKEDENRRKWSVFLFGKDPWDPDLYDLIIHIGMISVEDAANIILKALDRPCFQTTETGKGIMAEKLLAAEVRSALITEFPIIQTDVRDGVVHISMEDAPSTQSQTIARIENALAEAQIDTAVQIEITPVLGVD